jgi:hypothetical protein
MGSGWREKKTTVGFLSYGWVITGYSYPDRSSDSCRMISYIAADDDRAQRRIKDEKI